MVFGHYILINLYLNLENVKNCLLDTDFKTALCIQTNFAVDQCAKEYLLRSSAIFYLQEPNFVVRLFNFFQDLCNLPMTIVSSNIRGCPSLIVGITNCAIQDQKYRHPYTALAQDY